MYLQERAFNSGSCEESCWSAKSDKLIVWEPENGNSTTTPSSPVSGGKCFCKNNNIHTSRNTPVSVIISTGETVHLDLIVDGSHAAASYFKHPAPLFEATYEFIHSPLCGPSIIAANTEGELNFPHYEALGYTEPPRSIRCIWEIKVNKDRDVWLHFDKIRFTTKDCQDGKLEVYLPSRPENPFLTLCGSNVSAKDMPPLTSSDLKPRSLYPGYSPAPSVKIQFIGNTAPARAAFKIAWTELFHLPRNPDGTLMTSRLMENGVTSSPQTDCEFLCPGGSLCIPQSLVCNGHVNCPIMDWRGNESLAVGDEAVEMCASRTESQGVNWVMIGLGACGGVLLALACLIIICRSCCCCCCCNKRHRDDEDY